MTLVLNQLLVIFGFNLKRSDSKIRATLSFTLPKRLPVLWHWFVQPLREAPDLRTKAYSLVLRSEKLAIKIYKIFIVGIILSLFLFTFGIWGWAWFKVISFPFSSLILAIVSATAIFATSPYGRRGMVCWYKMKLGYADLRNNPRIPQFVRNRVEEIERSAEQKGAIVDYRLYKTYVDPILIARCYYKGKCERIIVAVYDDKSGAPFCE